MTNLWQFFLQTAAVSLTALLLLLVKRIFRSHLSSRWQYGIWSILALRILIPVNPARSLILPLSLWIESLKGTIESGLASSFTAPYAPLAYPHTLPLLTAPPTSLTDLLFCLYVAGVLIFLLWHAAAYIRLRMILSHGRPLSAVREQQLTAVCAAHNLPVCRAIEVRGLSTAFVCGVFRPILALPRDADVDDKVLLHELLHLRTGDVWQNIGWTLLQALHWCNPFAAYVIGRVKNDMEARCDSRVLERLAGEERREYGRILLAMANDRYPHTQGTTSISNGAKNISRRIRAIVHFKQYPRGMTLVSVCIAVILVVPLLLGNPMTASAADYLPQNQHALPRSLAMTRLNRCTTAAGAIDTFAKGIIAQNGLCLAAASPLASHPELIAAMEANAAAGRPIWQYDPGPDTQYVVWDSFCGYQLFNLRPYHDGYRVTLALRANDFLWNFSRDNGGIDSRMFDHTEETVLIPLIVRREDAWVAVPDGRPVRCPIAFNQIYAAESALTGEDNPLGFLFDQTVQAASGTVSVSTRIEAKIAQDAVQPASPLQIRGNDTPDLHLPQTDAAFSQLTIWEFIRYTAGPDADGNLPAESIGIQAVRISAPDQIVRFADERMEGTFSKGTNQGYAVANRMLGDPYGGAEGASINLGSGDAYYHPDDLPFASGYRIRLFRDGKAVEEITVWEDSQ